MSRARARWSVLVAGALFGVAPLAHADGTPKPDAPHAAAKGKHKGKHRAGRGMGSKAGPIATFPGFRTLEDGTTRVFVEMSGPVTVEEHKAQGAVTYTLKGARITSRNNKNALVTTHFNTPVARARLVPADDDIELVIELRAPTTPTERIVQGEGGRSEVQVDFPAGTFAVEPDQVPDAPKPRTPSDASKPAPKPAPPGGSSPVGPPAP